MSDVGVDSEKVGCAVMVLLFQSRRQAQSEWIKKDLVIQAMKATKLGDAVLCREQFGWIIRKNPLECRN